MAIFLIICIVLFLLWPNIKKWLARYMARKTEDFLRSATGMPPRDKSRARSSSRDDRGGEAFYGRAGGGRNEKRKKSASDGPIIPREYAEDVEFVESVEYSQTTIREALADGSQRLYTESQVRDVESVSYKHLTLPTNSHV